MRPDTLSRFLLVWIVLVIGCFSASTGKLMSCILPATLPRDPDTLILELVPSRRP